MWNDLYKILHIIVSDGMSSTAIVLVVVRDVNDNVPQFRPSQYNVHLRPSQVRYQTFLTVYAHDADSGAGAIVTYSITSGNEQGLFHIHPDTGTFLFKCIYIIIIVTKTDLLIIYLTCVIFYLT